jgi:dTDP-4-amino-4,6-dideoxygalactose transaminase
VTNDDAIASKWNAWIDRPSDAVPLSELQAAALLPQLDRLEYCNQRRWETILAVRSGVPWMQAALGHRCPHRLSTCYKLAFCSVDRDRTLRSLGKRGLPIGRGYRSMHRSSDRRCGKVGSLDNSRILGEQLCLLDHSVLLSTGLQRDTLIEMLRNGTR